MIPESIDQLKPEYTDKYVVVDAARPELARFRDTVGRVRTVNMSGRALVEFADYHLNIGWYDIDLAFVKVVDKPAPKPKEPPAKKPAAKPPGKAASAAGKPAPAKAAPARKSSTADILAAARAGKAPAKPPAADAPASATGGPAPAKTDRAKMSVADMLAAARAGGAAKAAPAPAKAKTQPDTAPAEDVIAQEETSAPEPVESTPAPAPAAKVTEKVDRSTMSVADMIAWCREHDAK